MWLFTNPQVVLGLIELISSIIIEIPYEINLWNSNGIITEYKFPPDQISWANALSKNKFPDEFSFGVSTSAYQIEGAWNTDDKEESTWDYITHLNSNTIEDHSNADVTADFYHKYKEDIRLARSLGSKVFRISLSWTRILPGGFTYFINPKGIQYYNQVIDEIIENGMTPMVTLFDWDLPYSLQKLGGFSNSIVVRHMINYARVAFDVFGNRVKHWITVNSPTFMCRYGYGGDRYAPATNLSGIADYLCGHNLLLAHAGIYNIYNYEFRPRQNGKVGIALDLNWFEPESIDSAVDSAAAERMYQFSNDWFLYPLFSIIGGYPEVMINNIAFQSSLQGYDYSRLPVFTEDQRLEISQSVDFLGINYNAAEMVRDYRQIDTSVSFLNDVKGEIVLNSRPGEYLTKNTPWGLRKLLRRMNSDYPDLPEMIITENGYVDFGEIEDVRRTVYYRDHIMEVLHAIKSGMNIQGYLAKSLTDGFEWIYGYTQKLGLYHVDFDDVNRTRTPKLSVKFITNVYQTRKILKAEDVAKMVVQMNAKRKPTFLTFLSTL